jgi:Na+/melibiose symporter-like transporter
MANIFFYATYILNATAEDPASYLLFISLLVPLIPGFFIWSKLGKKRGIRQVVMICSLFSATGLLLLFLAPDLTFSMISLAVVGAGLSGLMMFANVMIAESTDFDELRTKQRREAMFFATNALFTKPAIGLAEGVLAITLTLTGFIKEEFDNVTGETIIFDQPISALWGIKMVMGLFPAIALYSSIIFIYFYPNLKKSQNMKQQLSILHKTIQNH